MAQQQQTFTIDVAEREVGRTLSIVPTWDSRGVTWAAYLQAVGGGGTVYRSGTVAGAQAGEAINIGLDFGAVYDAADDPETAEEVPLPPGIYNVEVVAGRYEEEPRPYPDKSLRFNVIDYFSID